MARVENVFTGCGPGVARIPPSTCRAGSRSVARGESGTTPPITVLPPWFRCPRPAPMARNSMEMYKMLAEQTDCLIGVDTHRDQHSAAILASSGGLVDETSASADRVGYAKLLGWARRHAARRRVWAIEGSGAYRAGLTSCLDERGEADTRDGRRVRR